MNTNTQKENRPRAAAATPAARVARLVSEEEVKRLFPARFAPAGPQPAFPDQLHTFVGDCSSERQAVALVPQGDVLFTTNRLQGLCLIAVVGEEVSADYLEFLESMQISYIFAGRDGRDRRAALERPRHDFAIEHVEDGPF